MTTGSAAVAHPHEEVNLLLVLRPNRICAAVFLWLYALPSVSLEHNKSYTNLINRGKVTIAWKSARTWASMEMEPKATRFDDDWLQAASAAALMK